MNFVNYLLFILINYTVSEDKLRQEDSATKERTLPAMQWCDTPDN